MKKRNGSIKIGMLDKTVDYRNYATSPFNYRSPIDWIFYTIKLHPIVIAILLFFLVYFIGFIFALTMHFGQIYLRTVAVYIGCFGISWVMLIYHFSSLRSHEALEDLRPCFLVSDKVYQEKISYWFERFYSLKGNLSFFLIFFSLIFVLEYISFFHPELVGQSFLTSLRPIIFPSNWFSSPFLIGKFLLLLFFGLPVTLLLSFSLRGLIINFIFLLNLRHFPVIPISNIIRFRFRMVTDFYTRTSLGWFLGVGLFGILFMQRADFLSILLLSVLVLVGILTFLTPQFIFRKYLISSYRSLCDLTINGFYRQLGVTLIERKDTKSSEDIEDRFSSFSTLLEMIDASNKPPLWVYDSEDVIVYVLGQGIALIGIFASQILNKIATF